MNRALVVIFALMVASPAAFGSPSGDLDGNGRVEVLDAQALVRQLLGRDPARAAADLDGDSMVGILDLQLVINVAIGIRPAIFLLDPDQGPAGETVTITGQNLVGSPVDPEVRFGALVAVVQSATPDQLVVTVPAGAASSDVQVLHSGQSSNTLPFVVPQQSQGPVISDISPAAGAPGQAITLHGTGFDVTRSGNIVRFPSLTGSVGATVVAATATSIVVVVPVFATSGSVVVEVGGVSSAGYPFVVSSGGGGIPGGGGGPTIQYVSPNAILPGSQIAIFGQGFDPIPSSNAVQVQVGSGLYPLAVLGGTASALQARVPGGVPSGSGFLSVTTSAGTSNAIPVTIR